jgi:hypothetical protein
MCSSTLEVTDDCPSSLVAVAFCAAFGVAKVDKYLVVSQSASLFMCYFWAWWGAWVLGSEYASRYNNVDFTHKIFWTVYGMGVVGMLMHTGGGVDGPNAHGFCMSIAGVNFFVGAMTLRVALNVPEAKMSGLWHGFWMLTMAALWALAAVHVEGRWVWWTLAVLVEPLSSATFLLRFQEHLVPITKQYSINKFATICVLALGAFVAAAVGGVDPSSYNDQQRPAVRNACFLGFVLFMNLKFLVVDGPH